MQSLKTCCGLLDFLRLWGAYFVFRSGDSFLEAFPAIASVIWPAIHMAGRTATRGGMKTMASCTAATSLEVDSLSYAA